MEGNDRKQPVSGSFLVFLGRLLAPLWRRLSGPPPVWTEADFVPAGAEPICPTCTLPHHRLVTRCPHCSEYVGPLNTVLYLDRIYIWGKGLQDLVWRRELTPVLKVGLAVTALQYLATAVASGWDAVGWWSGNPQLTGWRGNGSFAEPLLALLTMIVYFVVSIRMAEALWRARRPEIEDP